MQRSKGRNNAKSLFGVEQIPCDQQIRNLLDPVAPGHLGAPFWTILARLSADKDMDTAYSFNAVSYTHLDVYKRQWYIRA